MSDTYLDYKLRELRNKQDKVKCSIKQLQDELSDLLDEEWDILEEINHNGKM